MFKGLPELCYGVLLVTQEVIIIKRGESGYYQAFDGEVIGKKYADELNRGLGVTPAQSEAMRTGSLFGWHVPGANPDIYDDEGHVIKEKL